MDKKKLIGVRVSCSDIEALDVLVIKIQKENGLKLSKQDLINAAIRKYLTESKERD